MRERTWRRKRSRRHFALFNLARWNVSAPMHERNSHLWGFERMRCSFNKSLTNRKKYFLIVTLRPFARFKACCEITHLSSEVAHCSSEKVIFFFFWSFFDSSKNKFIPKLISNSYAPIVEHQLWNCGSDFHNSAYFAIHRKASEVFIA